MRCVLCYHNAAMYRGLCSECACVVYRPANIPLSLNRDPLGLHRLALSGVGADGEA